MTYKEVTEAMVAYLTTQKDLANLSKDQDYFKGRAGMAEGTLEVLEDLLRGVEDND